MCKHLVSNMNPKMSRGALVYMQQISVIWLNAKWLMTRAHSSWVFVWIFCDGCIQCNNDVWVVLEEPPQEEWPAHSISDFRLMRHSPKFSRSHGDISNIRRRTTMLEPLFLLIKILTFPDLSSSERPLFCLNKSKTPFTGLWLLCVSDNAKINIWF